VGRRLTSASVARTIALLIAALVVALTIRHNTFAAWATDSGAYIAAGRAWAKGEVFTPATFVFWAPWAAGGHLELPLGHVQGPIPGTITSQYPLGYPVLMAAAIKVGGPLAAHLVSPVLAGVLAWCAFVLASRMSTPWAGVLAALMIAATPITFSHALIPFSDVPAVALWAIAWVMSLRTGYGAALAAGAAVAMAVMIRTNLAPLAVVIAAAVAVAERGTLRTALTRLVLFGALSAIGPLIVLWSQAALYGHPLQSGYRVPLDFFFKLERVPFNAALYPRLLVELHSWVAFGGLLFVPFAMWRMRASDTTYTRGVIAASAMGLIAVNYALYLPYLTYTTVPFLRFMLPAMLALFVLLAGGVDHLRVWINQWRREVAFVAVAPALIVVWTAAPHLQAPAGYERMLLMDRYLPHVLPDNAVVLTYSHGGAVAAATGRPILRLDMIAPEALDGIIADLQRRRHRPVYVFDTAIEGTFFTERFRPAQFSRLTWPARAELTSVTSIVYYDLADREAFFSGDRWPTDVLVEPTTAQGTVDWSGFRTTHERLVLPVVAESRAFRSELDAIYRDRLGRTSFPATIDPRESTIWLRRYLRFRLHGCSHASATAKVFQQLANGGAPGLCGSPDTIGFPPENETVDFRRRLEPKLPAERAVTTFVDPVGEAVWTQRYLDARLRGCAHAAAVVSVVQQMGGAAARCPG
jgi:hypothetical protein